MAVTETNRTVICQVARNSELETVRVPSFLNA